MFDLGLSKIALIGAVALVVLGPERLPKIARMAGALYGRAQRYMSDVKDEVSRDMALSELKEMGQSVQKELESARDAFADVAPPLGEPYVAPVNRTGRKHWRIKTTRAPQWYKQQTGVKTHITSEAARMASRHSGKKRHSFFN